MALSRTKGLTWAERAAADPELRRFVDCETARERLRADAWQAEAERWKSATRNLREQLDRLRTSDARERKSGRDRQLTHRRRRGQFATPLSWGEDQGA